MRYSALVFTVYQRQKSMQERAQENRNINYSEKTFTFIRIKCFVIIPRPQNELYNNLMTINEIY